MLIDERSPETMSIDELITNQAWLQVIIERIGENGHEVPTKISEVLREVNRTLDEKLRGDRERRLANLKSRRLAMSSIEEKRNRADEEIARLEKELGRAKTD